MKRLLILCAFAAGCSSPTAPTPAPIASVPPVAITPPVITPVNPWLSDPRFDQDFYADFAHGRFEINQLQPLARLPAAPRVFLNTSDEAGRPIDGVTLDAVSAAFIAVSSTWSGGAFGLAGIERGTGTRQAGWLTVQFDSHTDGALCGTSDHGVDGGTITFFYRKNCGCNGSAVRPSLAKHELGHAFGYWHTRSSSDLMTSDALAVCDKNPSERETYHTLVVYSRPIGSLDP